MLRAMNKLLAISAAGIIGSALLTGWTTNYPTLGAMAVLSWFLCLFTVWYRRGY